MLTIIKAKNEIANNYGLMRYNSIFLDTNTEYQANTTALYLKRTSQDCF